MNLIAVEKQLQGKRADAIVYTKDLQPLMLIEFKADTVALTQMVLDQIAVYNRQLHVPYLILHNGPQTIIARVTDTLALTGIRIRGKVQTTCPGHGFNTRCAKQLREIINHKS